MKSPKPKQNPKSVGECSEAFIIARLMEMGYGVLKPFGDNLRYDLVIEDADGKLWKIQCKTGRSNNECISFTTVSLYYHPVQEKPNMVAKPIMGKLITLLYIAVKIKEFI